MATARQAFLRSRDAAARVFNEELFFDLVYVFAVTQLSHYLLDHLTLLGALQALVMWFAVWLGWQYTAWTTNWFDPGALPTRGAVRLRPTSGESSRGTALRRCSGSPAPSPMTKGGWRCGSSR